MAYERIHFSSKLLENARIYTIRWEIGCEPTRISQHIQEEPLIYPFVASALCQ